MTILSDRALGGFQTKGTRAIVVYPTEFSGSNAVSRYLQGIECKTVDSLLKYVTVKPRSNIDLIDVKESRVVPLNAIFDDANSEIPTLRIDSKSSYTGVRSTINHELDKRDLGQGIFRFHDATPFLDHSISDPIEMMNLLSEGLLPDIFSVDSNGFEIADSFITPLYGLPGTREEKVERPFKMKGVKGSLSITDNIGNSCIVEQMIEKNDARVISLTGIRGGLNRRPAYLAGSDFYVDGVEYFAQDAEVGVDAIAIEGYINPNDSEVLPFVDGKDSEIFFSTISDNETRDMENALYALATNVDWPFFDRNHISSTAGYVYNNCSYGIDSLAYGGLLR